MLGANVVMVYKMKILEDLFLHKIVILFVAWFLLSGCSINYDQKIQPSSKYFLYDSNVRDSEDMKYIQNCLKNAGVHFKVKPDGVYVPENEGDLVEECN